MVVWLPVVIHIALVVVWLPVYIHINLVVVWLPVVIHIALVVVWLPVVIHINVVVVSALALESESNTSTTRFKSILPIPASKKNLEKPVSLSDCKFVSTLTILLEEAHNKKLLTDECMKLIEPYKGRYVLNCFLSM